jgi:hypothetical protein
MPLDFFYSSTQVSAVMTFNGFVLLDQPSNQI